MAHRRKKNDKQAIGFFLGILFPLVGLIVVYYLRYSDFSLREFVNSLWQYRVLIKILSLCAFLNLLLFLFYIRYKMDHAARGVLAATLVYALLVLASRLF
ncbi:hypothetical protein MNBD_BACTEROID01-2062 [hydrothermal vent metagenome]|uniref:Uncharacterized protein n=1 Tax=hydrothermal vent metagenome TaxID=652676 RepID=A0A3B0TZB2_9ZZZZ